MPIISAEILKTKDERGVQKQTKTERSQGNKIYGKRMRAK